jgi:hypothetical protein
VGLARLALVLACSQETIDSDELLQVFVGMNYLHFALFLFAICSLVIVVVSMCTQPEATDVEAVTWSLELCVQPTPSSGDDEANAAPQPEREPGHGRARRHGQAGGEGGGDGQGRGGAEGPFPRPSSCGASDHFLPPLGQKVAAATLVGVVAFLYILLR